MQNITCIVTKGFITTWTFKLFTYFTCHTNLWLTERITCSVLTFFNFYRKMGILMLIYITFSRYWHNNNEFTNEIVSASCNFKGHIPWFKSN